MSGSLIGALRVTLGIDTAAFEKGLGIAQKRLNATGKKFDRIGRKMQNIGKSMTLGITAPVVALGAASVKASSDFETAMTNVSTLVDTTTESMKEMGAAVLDISKRVPVAAEDLTAALYDVRSAGVDAADAMGVLENSAKLGVAGLGSTSEAVDLVTSSLNAFELTGADANKVYDNIFRTVKSGKTTISDLSQGFGAVSGTVSAAGIKLDDYLSSVAALTTTGLPAAQAHTQMRAAIAGLTRETGLSKKVFSDLGVKTFSELIAKSGGVGQAFTSLRDATGNNAATLIKLLGSTEAYNAVLSISGAQNEAYTETLAGMRDGTDAMGEAFDKQSSTMAAKSQMLKNTLNVAAVQIGEVLVPVVAKLADFVSSLADRFSNLSPSLQKAVIAFAAIAAAVGPVLVVAGTLVSAWGKIMPLFAGLSTIMGTAGFTATLGALAAAAAPFVAAGVALAGAWYLFGDKVGPVLTSLKEKFTAVLGPKLQSLFDTVKTTLTELWNGPFGKAIRAVIDVLGDFGAAYTSVLGEGLIRVLGVVVSVVEGAFKQIVNAFTLVAQLLSGDFAGAWETAKNMVSTAINTMLNVIDSLIPGAGKYLSQLFVVVKGKVAEIASNMVQGGRDMIAGLVNGILAAPRAVLNALMSIVKSGWEGVKSFLGIASPSKLFMEMGGFVTDGLAVGITNGTDTVNKAMNGLNATFSGQIGKTARNIEALLVKPSKKAATEIEKAFRTLAQNTLSLLDRLFPVQAQIRSIMTDLKTLDDALAGGLISPEDHAAGKAKLEAERANIQNEPARKREEELKAITDRFLPKAAEMAELTRQANLLRAAIAEGGPDADKYREALAEIEAAMVKANEWPLADKLDGLLDGLFPLEAELKTLRGELDLLDEGLAAGEIDPAKYERAREELLKSLDATELALQRQKLASTEMGRLVLEAGKFGSQIGTSIMDALHDGIEGKNVFASLKESFSNVLKNVAHKSLESVEKAIFGEGGIAGALDQLFQSLFQSILGGAQGGGGSGGGLGSIIGSVIGSLFGGGRSGGGPVMANTPYLVGEKRPELFVSSTAGRVVPNMNELRTAGGGSGAPYFDLRGAVMTKDLLNQMNAISREHTSTGIASYDRNVGSRVKDNVARRG